VADEGDFDAGVDEGDVLAGDRLLHGSHDAEVGARKVLAAVDRHRVQSPLSLQRHAHRQQQVAMATSANIVAGSCCTTR